MQSHTRPLPSNPDVPDPGGLVLEVLCLGGAARESPVGGEPTGTRIGGPWASRPKGPPRGYTHTYLRLSRR